MVQDLRNYCHLLSCPAGNKNVDETNALSLTQENHLASTQASSVNEDAPIQEARVQAVEATASIGTPDGQEAYERGMVLKNVGLFRQAAEHFEQAAQDPLYALKGFAPNGSQP